MLESHGGVVNLVEITNEGDAVLQFGAVVGMWNGGCNPKRWY